MGYLTKLPGVPDSDQAVTGMAYFANTGPAGATCGKCSFYGLPRTKGYENKCRMYRQMHQKGHWGADLDKMQSACKYFEAEPS
jgi:hypothetical protein